MTTKTITYGNVSITVKRTTVWGAVVRDALADKLRSAAPEAVHPTVATYRNVFARLASQTDSAAGLPFALPTLASSDDELRAALAGYWQLDEALIDLWSAAVVEVDRPLGDPKLQPIEDVPEDLKADPNSGSTAVKPSKR